MVTDKGYVPEIGRPKYVGLPHKARDSTSLSLNSEPRCGIEELDLRQVKGSRAARDNLYLSPIALP